MRDDASTRGSQRGQALILAMLVMTVIFAIGAMVVDLGLWLSERRGAQTDADFVALAGAWELLDPNGDVVAAANSTLDANQEETDASGTGTASLANLTTNGNCVVADVRHSSVSLFSGIFGIFAPDIGARARACAGATNAPEGIVPFEIDNNDPTCFDVATGAPKFGALCPLDYGLGSTPREILDLIAGDNCSNDAPGGNVVSVIESGATGTCLRTGNSCSGSQWNDCVFVRDVPTNNVIKAVADRLASKGIPEPCDDPGGATPGVDDRDETIDIVFDTGDPDTSLYQAKDCDSPRLASVIVLDQDPSPGDTSPIETFAGFYIAGCHQLLLPAPGPGDLDTDCDDTNGGGSGSGNHNVIYGEFVNLIVENSSVGEARPSTTLFSTSLEE